MIIKKINFKNIKNSKFIIIPKPHKNEVLSSWLARTSYAHHTYPLTFIKLHLQNYCSSKNIDLLFDKTILDSISIKAQHKIDTYNLSLKALNGILQENIISNGANKTICPQRYCPVCLREDGILYYRKDWKIVFNTVCLKHNCFLYDKCTQCNTKLNILHMFENKKYFRYCSKCGFDLAKSKKLTLSKLFKNEKKKLIRLSKIIDDGYIIFKNKPIYSFLFFDAFLQLCKIILMHKNIEFIKNHNLFHLLQLKKYSSAKPVYHQLSIKEQYILFSIVFTLFENYPLNLEKFIKENNLSHWKILRDMNYVSYWFEDLIHTISPRYVPTTKLITVEEINNCKKYLKSKKLPINKANLSKYLGCNFFSIYNNLEV